MQRHGLGARRWIDDRVVRRIEARRVGESQYSSPIRRDDAERETRCQRSSSPASSSCAGRRSRSIAIMYAFSIVSCGALSRRLAHPRLELERPSERAGASTPDSTSTIDPASKSQQIGESVFVFAAVMSSFSTTFGRAGARRRPWRRRRAPGATCRAARTIRAISHVGRSARRRGGADSSDTTARRLRRLRGERKHLVRSQFGLRRSGESTGVRMS